MLDLDLNQKIHHFLIGLVPKDKDEAVAATLKFIQRLVMDNTGLAATSVRAYQQYDDPKMLLFVYWYTSQDTQKPTQGTFRLDTRFWEPYQG